jgi:ComF family protein
MSDGGSQSVKNAMSKAWAWPGLSALWEQGQRIREYAADLIFPPRCVGCGRIDTAFCEDCRRAARGVPLVGKVGAIVPLAGAATTAEHRGILREMVQALKYENAQPLARPLGERLAACLDAQEWTIDMIVPVPLHTSRLRERGYNQSQLLGEHVADLTGIRCIPAALRRIRATQSQVTITAQERLTNVRDAFTADPASASGRTILLIDDVYTTGATLRACAEALLLVDAAAVYGLTVTAARI